MERGCFIGIDQGSSSSKAVVVGTDGTVQFRAKRELSPPLRDGVRVEQNPEEILRSLREVLNEAALYARDGSLPVLGAGLSCQRSSCLVWNEASGEALSPVISWRDTRGSSVVNGLMEHKERIFDLTGLPLTPYYSASKLRWLCEHVPSTRERAAIFGTLSSFLAHRLTGARHAVIDHTNAARTQLMNIASLAWDPYLSGLFQLGEVRLPAIVPTISDYGNIETAAGPIPLLACIGDQQAALLGLGVTGEGDCGINYGTGAFLLMNTGRALKKVAGLMTSVHYSTRKERQYLLEGSVNAAGDALEWLRSRFGLFGGHDEVDDLCWRAATDVVAFLALNGTGSPHWENGISSAITGLTIDSGPQDIVRATVEGIAFFILDIVDALRATGVEAASFVVSGGLSSISYLVQTQADLLGRDILVSSSSETTAQGAAFLAGMGQCAWSAEDISRMAAVPECTPPRVNSGLTRRRRRWTALHQAVRALDSM